MKHECKDVELRELVLWLLKNLGKFDIGTWNISKSQYERMVREAEKLFEETQVK